MNCLYITLFFSIVAGIVQTFINESWNQLLYPLVIEVCRQPFEPRHDFFLHLIIFVELLPSLLGFRSGVKNPCFISSHNGFQKLICFLCVHLLRWEIVWRNAPRIWRDFGSALPFQTRLTQRKPILPLSDEHGSQVKDQVRWQCCHNKHKKCSYRPTRDVSLLPAHASYFMIRYDCIDRAGATSFPPHLFFFRGSWLAILLPAAGSINRFSVVLVFCPVWCGRQ